MSWTVVVQQEWEAGISISPQSPAMAMQHSRSSSVNTAPGSMQAIKGEAQIDSASARIASLPVHLTMVSLVFPASMRNAA